MSKTKLYKLANTGLNLSLAFVLFFAFYFGLDGKLKEVNFSIDHISPNQILLFVTVSLLTILNWTLEWFKWTRLINIVHPLDKHSSIKSIFLGIAANLIAPNRTGDLAGRLRFIPSSKRWQALYINFFCASSQLMITLLIGIAAMVLFIVEWKVLAINPAYIAISGLLLSIVSLMLYFRSNTVLEVFKHFKKTPFKWVDVQIPAKSRAAALFLSTVRYFVFLLQFHLILLALGLEISFLHSAISLALIFFINSFLPSNLILELLSKGTAIYFVFEALGHDPVLGVSASVVLWLLNVGIPALIGIYFVKDIQWLNKKDLKIEDN